MIANLVMLAQTVTVQVPTIPPPQAQLARWTVGAAECAGAPVAWVRAPAPIPFIRNAPVTAEVGPTYGFTVDADGRLLDIRRKGAGHVAHGEDLAPALAAAHAAPAGRSGCTVRFTVITEPLATAPIQRVFAYAAQVRVPPRSVLARINAAGGDCMRPPYSAIRRRTYPDYRALPATPGAPSWTVTLYDINARGAPVRVATAGSSGNVALDRAAVDAVARSRWEPRARTGCLAPTPLNAATLAAPPLPEERALRPAGATCPDTLPNVRPPSLTMPEAYRRRAIEGWAVIAYDVAPWGATGNARVLSAQPTAEFGEWALRVVGSVAKPASSTGHTGCVDRVRFAMGEQAKLLVSGEEVIPPETPPAPF